MRQYSRDSKETPEGLGKNTPIPPGQMAKLQGLAVAEIPCEKTFRVAAKKEEDSGHLAGTNAMCGPARRMSTNLDMGARYLPSASGGTHAMETQAPREIPVGKPHGGLPDTACVGCCIVDGPV